MNEKILPPVTVLSGFLGAGKTTLLRRLLAAAGGRKFAVVVNDLAALNIDAQLIAQAGAGRTVALGGGCVCCTVRDELAETLAELCATGGYDHVLVETTGVAEPRAVADLFGRKNAFGRSLADFARLHALVTVVDARGFLAELARRGAVGAGGAKPVFELMADQAECADVIVVNKCDLATPDELARLEEILRGLNPRAEILRAEQGQLAGDLLAGPARFEAGATLGAAKWIRLMRAGGQAAAGPARGARHEERFGITSFVYEARAPLVREKLRALMATEIFARLLRAKGFFWLAEQPADIGFLSLAGGVARTEFVGTWAAALRERGVITAEEIPAAARAKWVEPHGDRRQELVFIGQELDEAALRAALDMCRA